MPTPDRRVLSPAVLFPRGDDNPPVVLLERLSTARHERSGEVPFDEERQRREFVGGERQGLRQPVSVADGVLLERFGTADPVDRLQCRSRLGGERFDFGERCHGRVTEGR